MSNKNPNIRALKLLHSFSPLYFPVVVMQAFFSNIAPYFNLYLSAEIINEITGHRNIRRLLFLVCITVIGNFTIEIIAALFQRLYEHSEIRLNQNEEVFINKKTLLLDYADIENPEVRQLRRKIIESAKIDYHGKQSLLRSVKRMINIGVSMCFNILLWCEMLVGVMSYKFNFVPVLYLIMTIVLIVFNIGYIFRKIKELSEFSNHLSQEMIDENRIDEAIECYNMGKDIRIYKLNKLIMNVKYNAFNSRKKSAYRMASKRFLGSIPLNIISYIQQILTYIFICHYAIKGVLGTGSIIKYVGFSQKMIESIIELFNIYAEVKNNTPFIKEYLAYTDIPQKMFHGDKSVEKVFNEGYELEFRNVSFKYPGTDKWVLKNITLKLSSNDRVALVGMNGSGKTTFVKLICRLYDPSEGEILLNGINIKEYNYNEYMSIFSVVFQDFKLLSFSLAKNISTNNEYSSNKVKESLIKVGLEKRLSQMPDGIETYLYKDFDQNGVELSGGEAQKIALARAIYKDSPIIILDEPTAALDPIAEYEIFLKFNEIVSNKTAIYISHRMSACRFCKKIVVFDRGHIVQMGSHAQLVDDKKGKYYELWQAQAKYYM